jgi:hypothetical protein
LGIYKWTGPLRAVDARDKKTQKGEPIEEYIIKVLDKATHVPSFPRDGVSLFAAAYYLRKWNVYRIMDQWCVWFYDIIQDLVFFSCARNLHRPSPLDRMVDW